MATKTDDDVGPETKKKGKEKGGKKNLILIAVVAAVLGAVVYKFLLPAKAATVEDPGAATTTTVVQTDVVTLDPITLNLADGHLLKVGMALEVVLGEEHGATAGSHSETTETTVDEKTKGYAHAIDIAISVFGARNYGDIVLPEGREGAKAELVGKLHEAYHGEITDVFLYQFVAQ